MARAVLCFCTLPNQDIAASIARTLVEEQLAACVNLLPGVRSIYRWQDAVHDDSEILAIIKTQESTFGALKSRILSLHPYELPEVISVPIEAAHQPYLDWIAAVTRSS